MFLLVDMPDETQLNKAIVVGTTFLVDYMSVEQQNINILTNNDFALFGTLCKQLCPLHSTPSLASNLIQLNALAPSLSHPHPRLV